VLVFAVALTVVLPIVILAFMASAVASSIEAGALEMYPIPATTARIPFKMLSISIAARINIPIGTFKQKQHFSWDSAFGGAAAAAGSVAGACDIC